MDKILQVIFSSAGFISYFRSMNAERIVVVLFIAIGAFVAVKKHKLTASGGIGGAAIGMLVYLGADLIGLMMLAAFFILGTIATAWKSERKQGKQEERRKLSQVLANGGLAGLLGLLSILFPDCFAAFTAMIAAALASATADTLSSELGTLYGRRFYNILTFQKDQKGLDGVISIEGLIIGVFGSAVIAAIYSSYFGWSRDSWIIVVCGTVGNITDSILGAALERKGWIKNDAVNLLNTVVAALFCWLLL